jgi:putative membrane protein
MKKHTKRLLSVLSVILCALLFISGISITTAFSADTNVIPTTEMSQKKASVQSKSEIVYAKLNAEGTPNGIYVVNHFDVSESGNIVDYGDYTRVINLTDTSPLSIDGDQITLTADAGNYYYQGDSVHKNLPWIISISYSLNGKAVQANELAGETGYMEIHITTRFNPDVENVFYNNYMLQITLNLDTEKCSNITATDAVAASVGKNRVLTYTVMPGNDADITISSNINDFSMTGVEIAGMPFSIPAELPDTDEMVDEMTSLSDAIDALHNGVGKLNDGVKNFNTGVSSITSGSSDITSGLSALNGNSSNLIDGSVKIKSALDQIVASMTSTGAGTSGGIGDLVQLPDGLRQMAQGLEQMVEGLTRLKDGYADMFSILDVAIMELAKIPVDPAQLTALQTLIENSGDTDAQAAFGQLIAYYTAGQTLVGTYTTDTGNGSIQAGLSSVTGALEKVINGDPSSPNNIGLKGIASTLRSIADNIEIALNNNDIMNQLRKLVDALSELAKNYSAFHAGLVDYTNGVKQIAGGYAELHNGIISLQSGAEELETGTQRLYNGSGELNTAVADLPEDIQIEIDKIMEDYTPKDFEPVSFTSVKNTNTTFVQFVLICESIEPPDEPGPPDPEPGHETIWDRFLSLFQFD